jgi:type I site-specific restriction endonuclease
VAAGWNVDTQVREEISFTDGRIYVRGKVHARGKQKRADYILYYKPNIPIAVIEAKDNNHTVSDGIQQALAYAQTLDIPFVFSSNGDGYPRLIETGSAQIALAALRAQIASGAEFRLFTAPQAFRGSYEIVRDQNTDPVKLAARKLQIREQLRQEAQRRGVSTPSVSDQQILEALRSSEAPVLLKFYEAFFACEDIPKNRTRFPYEQLTAGLL